MMIPRMSETFEKCIDIAEFYDIDWCKGEFSDVFADRACADSTLKAISDTHQANIAAQLTWAEGREAIIATLATMMSVIAQRGSDSSGIAWVEGDDAEMAFAIRQAQDAFQIFVDALNADQKRAKPLLEAAVIKAFFPVPNDSLVGEHMFVDNIEIVDGQICGTLGSEPAGIPGLKMGQGVQFPPGRVSDWFYVVDGVGHGGFTLSVMAKRMTEDALAEAKQYPPFLWFPDLTA
jgi:uncharacterized protein YegJ (DUF2314 family)